MTSSEARIRSLEKAYTWFHSGFKIFSKWVVNLDLENIHHKPTNRNQHTPQTHKPINQHTPQTQKSTKLRTHKPTVGIHISTVELRDREMKERDLPI